MRVTACAARDLPAPGPPVNTRFFPVGRRTGSVEWPGAVGAGGEDGLGRDGGADRVSARGHRAGAPQGRGRQRLAAGQGVLGLGPGFGGGVGGPLPVTSSRMGHLLDALARGYDLLGFGRATGGDEVFRQLVLARIIEPVSKLDSLRVLEEAGVAPVSYAMLKRRLPAYATASWRHRLAAAGAAHAGLGPASLLLYDVSRLHFGTGTGDGFRESGFWHGAPAGAADHHRAAHRRLRVPADDQRPRGQHGRDQDDAAGDRSSWPPASCLMSRSWRTRA